MAIVVTVFRMNPQQIVYEVDSTTNNYEKYNKKPKTDFISNRRFERDDDER